MKNQFRYNKGYWTDLMLSPEQEELPRQLELLDKFKSHPNYWFTGHELSMEFNCSKLCIRQNIRLLRKSGLAIISNIRKGYMLTTDNNLLNEYVMARLREIFDEQETLNKMKVR